MGVHTVQSFFEAAMLQVHIPLH